MKQKDISACQYIANHYGYESQSRQLIEEMAELMQAINKQWRNFFCKDTEAKIVEEIADVEICLEQIKFLMGCGETIEEKHCEKITRQLKRIAEEKCGVI